MSEKLEFVAELDSNKLDESNLIKILLDKKYLTKNKETLTLNENFVELMFAIFLAYFSNARMCFFRDKKPLEEKYVFLPFADKTIFAANLEGFSLLPMRSLADEKAIPSQIFDEKVDNKCLSQYFFMFNITKNGAYGGGDFKYKQILEKVPSCSPEKCNIKIDDLKRILHSDLSDADLGRFFDCRVIKLNVPFEDLNFLINENTEYYQDNFGLEKIFIQLLGIFLGIRLKKYQFLCGAYLKEPKISNEMDVVFLGDKKVIDLEFSCITNLIMKYWSRKINNFHYLKSQHPDMEVFLVCAFTGKKSELDDSNSKERKHLDFHGKNIRIIKMNETYADPSDGKWKSIGIQELRDMFNALIGNIQKEIESF